jgi:hypothetical protein
MRRGKDRYDAVALRRKEEDGGVCPVAISSLSSSLGNSISKCCVHGFRPVHASFNFLLRATLFIANSCIGL